MSNRIEQVIGDIEEYIDGCKVQAFSNTKIIVDRPQIEDFLDELRQYTPEEVKKYQRMLNNRDKILSDAKKKANDVEEKAQAYADRMVSETRIVKLADDKAKEIMMQAREAATQMINDAEAEAKEIRDGALQYTNDLLTNLQSILANSINDYQNYHSQMIAQLNENLNIVSQNIRDLNQQNQAEPEEIDSTPFFDADAALDDAGMN